jgi:hypothetical protein
MKTPAQISIVQPDDTLRKIIVEPILEKNGDGLTDTGVYKIYKDAFGDETVLITEPRETGENTDLADTANPDYLGKITFTDPGQWNYEGDILSNDEQLQVITFLKESAPESDILN